MIVEDYCVSQDQFVKGLFVSKLFCILKGTKVRNERERARAGDQKMMHFFHLTLLQMQFHKGNASSQDKATAFDQQLLCVPPPSSMPSTHYAFLAVFCNMQIWGASSSYQFGNWQGNYQKLQSHFSFAFSFWPWQLSARLFFRLQCKMDF